jgi:uncharacterized protein (DUF983 family)
MALTTGTLLKRGFRRRCAVCGQGHLFRRWLVMAERCPRCGFRFQREPGQWLGSWFLNICLAQLLVVLLMIAAVVIWYPAPPAIDLVVAGVATAVLFPLWFFPYSRTIWVAIDLAMTPLEFDEGVDPQWELEADLARLLEDENHRPQRG